MKRMVLGLLLFVSTAGMTARADASGEGPKPLDVKKFFEAIKGEYRVELIGGATPVSHVGTATVDLWGNDVILQMPYCRQQGVCDPGYLFLPLRQAKVIVDGKKHDIAVSNIGGPDKYEWIFDGSRVICRNYQYKVDAVTFIVLEHVLRKLELGETE